MGRIAVSRMVTQCGTFVRASVSRLTICARALMRRVPYLYQRSLCRGRSRDSRGRGLTGSSGCTSSRASLLACRRLRGASGVCLDHCRKSVEAFCAEDPIPRLSDSLTCRQASCTHVSLFGPSVCRSIQYAGECRWAPVSGETIIARTGGCRRSVGTGEHDADLLRWESSSLRFAPLCSVCTQRARLHLYVGRTLVHLSLAAVSSSTLGP